MWKARGILLGNVLPEKGKVEEVIDMDVVVGRYGPDRNGGRSRDSDSRRGRRNYK